MLFSVIYELDVPRSEAVGQYLPKQRHLFQQTEGDDCYEYSHLEGDWEKGKHRKLCGILTKEQFERFLSDTGLQAEDCETMGSLGAPGFGLGWAPAISFRGDHYSALSSAYVTPIPMVKRVRDLDKPPHPARAEKGFSENDWERVRTAVISKYKYGA